jgi:transposase-like protein
MQQSRYYHKTISYFHLKMDECRNIHSDVVDRFRVNNKNQVKMIFVDETLIQIDGKDYWWLWIA